MGSHKKKGHTSPEVLPPPVVPDYHVTGPVSPDITCNYYENGTHDGWPIYSRGDNAYHIYYVAATGNSWISNIIGYYGSEAWWKYNPFPQGDYQPVGPGNSGTATVSAGGH